MYKTSLITLLISFSLGQLYCQNVKFEEKLITKLDRKYDFVSVKKGIESRHYDKCNKILVGDYIYGPSDGGGSSVIGAKNLKYIDTEGREVGSPPNFNLYEVNRANFGQVLMARYPSGLIGLIDLCGEKIMEPKYNEINSFNESGLAVAFVNNTIDIIDTAGNSLLDKRIDYEVNYEQFNAPPKASYLSSIDVIDGKFFHRGPNKLFALYDVLSKKNLTDYKYDFIDLNFVVNDGVKYFKVRKGDKYNLIEISSGKELIADTGYFDIRNFEDFFGNLTVQVLTNKEIQNWNLFRLKDKKLLFPINIPILSFEEKKFTGKTKKWVALNHGDENGLSLFDIEVDQYVIEPKKEYKDFKFNTDFVKTNTVVIKFVDDSIQLFDIENKGRRNLSISGKKLDIDSFTFKDGKIWFKAFSEKLFSNFREITLFDSNWNQIYQGVAVISIQGELLKISESTDTENTKRPYLLNSNGKPVEDAKN